MSDSYVERIKREGPLPKVDDESDLVGEDDKKKGAAAEHAGDFVTIPARGAGSYSVPTVSGDDPERDADAENSDGHDK